MGGIAFLPFAVVHSESLGPHSKVLGLNNSHTNMDEEVLVEKGSKSIPGSGMGTASVQDRHNRRKRHGVSLAQGSWRVEVENAGKSSNWREFKAIF